MSVLATIGFGLLAAYSLIVIAVSSVIFWRMSAKGYTFSGSDLAAVFFAPVLALIERLLPGQGEGNKTTAWLRKDYEPQDEKKCSCTD